MFFVVYTGYKRKKNHIRWERGVWELWFYLLHVHPSKMNTKQISSLQLCLTQFLFCVVCTWKLAIHSCLIFSFLTPRFCTLFKIQQCYSFWLSHPFLQQVICYLSLRIGIPFQVQLLTFKALKVPAPIYLQLLIGIYFPSWLETQLWITLCLFPQHPVCSVDVSISQMQSYP